MICLSGSALLGEADPQNDIFSGGSVDYQMVRCDFLRVYHLGWRYTLPNSVPPPTGCLMSKRQQMTFTNRSCSNFQLPAC